MNQINRKPEKRVALLAHLREHYVYEPDGRIRHKSHDKPLKGQLRRATYKQKIPYIQIKFRVNGERYNLLYQQAVWVVCKGRWPTMQLDHLNGNKQDNRIENLRECSPRDNNLNVYLTWKPNAKTGVPGVCKIGIHYKTKLRGKNYLFHYPYEAFYWAMMIGKKYKQE